MNPTYNELDLLISKIKHKKCTSEFEATIIEQIIKGLGNEIVIPEESILYRAREFDVNNEKHRPNSNAAFQGFDAANSLAPPPIVVKDPGRLNCVYESVLYVAEDKYTALAEMKLERRKHVSLAELKLKEPQKLYKFMYTEKHFEPDCLMQLYNCIALEFYKSVHVDSEYLFTQYVSKELNRLGYDGVMYSSSVSENGVNVMLFDINIANAVNSKLFIINSVGYLAFAHDHERLLPKSITDRFSKNEIDEFLEKFKGSNGSR